MNNDKDLIKRLNFENFIWITFIIVSALDIYGDELIKKSVVNNDLKSKNLPPTRLNPTELNNLIVDAFAKESKNSKKTILMFKKIDRI